MVSTELEILIASRSLIAHPDNWCRGVEARDAKGNEVAPEEEDAVARCAVGALGAITRWSELYPRAVSVLTGYLPCGFSSIIDFNDASNHSEVLALFDRAIAAQRARAGSANLIKRPLTTVDCAALDLVERTPPAAKQPRHPLGR